jgi:hypothetical protein
MLFNEITITCSTATGGGCVYLACVAIDDLDSRGARIDLTLTNREKMTDGSFRTAVYSFASLSAPDARATVQNYKCHYDGAITVKLARKP